MLNSKDIKVPLVIYNPRRKSWNENAKATEIYKQIDWELEHMEKADIIIVNILGESKSPITLMEIGIHCHDDKMIVYCPESFWRFENVKAVCERFDIPLYTETNVEKVVNDLIVKLSK